MCLKRLMDLLFVNRVNQGDEAMNFKFTGKGMYLWRIRDTELGDIPSIVAKAQVAGYTHVLIKIADGGVGYNYIDGVDKAKELADALKAVGIMPVGWQYIYGVDPRGEALTAVRRMRETGCMSFVIDAEGEYLVLADNKLKAAEYMSYLTFPEPKALSSFRYPEVQYQMPWAEFLAGCSAVMPQVYWKMATNPAEQLEKSYMQYRKITDLPYIPTGAAYCADGWCPTDEQIVEFADKAAELGLPGINFWEWAAAVKDGFWETVRDIDWEQPTEPEEPEQTELEKAMEEIAELKKRASAVILAARALEEIV